MDSSVLPASQTSHCTGSGTPPSRRNDRPGMRILLAIDSLDIGGAERHVCDLATGLHKRGHQVVVACSAGGLLAAELGEAGVTVHALMDRRVKRREDALYAWRMQRLIFDGG